MVDRNPGCARGIHRCDGFGTADTSSAPLALNALAIAFFSATQDITIDASAADICSPAEIGAGSSTKVLDFFLRLGKACGACILAFILLYRLAK